MTVSISQKSFTGGEWAPSLYARVDLDKYNTAARTMLNFFPHPHGGASNRGGKEFIGFTKNPDKIDRLVKFQFSTTQGYSLEFGDLYIRFCKDGARVVESDVTISGATAADPVVITATGHGYDDGDWITLSSVVGMTEINSRTFIVANKATNTFELTDVDGNDVDGSAYTAYSSGGVANKIYEVTTSYVEADLALLKFTQSADVLYITHPTYPPATLSRTGHTAWTLANTTFAPSISAPGGFTGNTGTTNTYAATAVSTAGEESVPSSTATADEGESVSWSAVTGADHYNIYQVKNGLYGYLGTAVGLSFTTEADIDPDMDDTAPRTYNPFSGADNYPGCSVFYEQRWVAARTNNKVQSVFGSVTGAFTNMNKSTPLKADDSFEFAIDSEQVNEIRWMVNMDTLIIGTSGGEFGMGAGTNSDSVTPTSVDISSQSRWGVSHVPPIIVGNSILMLEASNAAVRDLAYSLEVDGYKGNDLSILSNHFFKGFEITSWAYQQHPDSIIWCVRNDGRLIGLTYHREHKVWAWHQHSTQGKYKSVVSARNSSGVSEIYVTVERTLNGVTRKSIEIFKDRLPRDSYGNYSVQDAHLLDCSLTLNSPLTITGATAADPVVITSTSHGLANGDSVDITRVQGMSEINEKRFKIANVSTHTFELTDELTDEDIDGTAYTAYTSGGEARKCVTVLTGLNHLEGVSVKIFANGSVYPSQTVVSGKLTLTTSASRVRIGLGYTCDLETLDLNIQTQTGDVQDKTRSIDSVLLELENTRQVLVGPSEDRLDEISFREDEVYGAPTDLYNGDKEKNIEPGGEREGRVFIRVEDPVPCTILSVTARMDYGER